MEVDGYKHGIVWMDWQHADLIKEFRALHAACKKGDSALAIMKSSRTLERYIEDHFGLEETYMDKYGFPDFKRHQQEHATFGQKFKEFRETGLAGADKVGADLLLLMVDWIMKHIMVADKEVAKFLAREGVQ
ncbi:MAG: hemerythrin family protein [Thermodesulfobacteriota bacterium]